MPLNDGFQLVRQQVGDPRGGCPRRRKRAGTWHDDIQLSEATTGDDIQLSEATTGDGAAIFRHACWMDLEGIVSKRIGSRYVRSTS